VTCIESPANKVDATPRLALSTLLPQLGGALAGVSALAYVAGRQEVQSYLLHIGASWAFTLMPASQVMQESASLLILLGTITFLVVISILENKSTAAGLRRWSIIWGCAAVVTFIVADLPTTWVPQKTALFLATLTGIFWAISAALTIGELVAEVRTPNFAWKAYHLWLVYFIFIFGLRQAPDAMGAARAALDIDPKLSSLPRIAPPSSTEEPWRLITSMDGKFLLVRLSADAGDRMFRLLNTAEGWEIRPKK